jgi:acetyl esterase/lipase
MPPTPPYEAPFVLETPAVERVRDGRVDLYPAVRPGGGRRPGVLLIHGGPVPEQLIPTPRDWPSYRGYGGQLALRNVVAATVDHRLHAWTDYPRAARDVADAVDRLRADPRVDPDRIALWFFSGGGLLSAGWFTDQPTWLRCLALTYPHLVPREGTGVDPRFRPVEAIAAAGSAAPVVLTRVGLEAPAVAAGVAEFVEAEGRRGVRTRLIDVPHGHHGFDSLDYDDQSRAAVIDALDTVVAFLG